MFEVGHIALDCGPELRITGILLTDLVESLLTLQGVEAPCEHVALSALVAVPEVHEGFVVNCPCNVDGKRVQAFHSVQGRAGLLGSALFLVARGAAQKIGHPTLGAACGRLGSRCLTARLLCRTLSRAAFGHRLCRCCRAGRGVVGRSCSGLSRCRTVLRTRDVQSIGLLGHDVGQFGQSPDLFLHHLAQGCGALLGFLRQVENTLLEFAAGRLQFAMNLTGHVTHACGSLVEALGRIRHRTGHFGHDVVLSRTDGVAGLLAFHACSQAHGFELLGDLLGGRISGSAEHPGRFTCLVVSCFQRFRQVGREGAHEVVDCLGLGQQGVCDFLDRGLAVCDAVLDAPVGFFQMARGGGQLIGIVSEANRQRLNVGQGCFGDRAQGIDLFPDDAGGNVGFGDGTLDSCAELAGTAAEIDFHVAEIGASRSHYFLQRLVGLIELFQDLGHICLETTLRVDEDVGRVSAALVQGGDDAVSSLD